MIIKTEVPTAAKTFGKIGTLKAGVLVSSLALAAVLAGCNQGGGGTTTTATGTTASGPIVTVNGEGVARGDLYAQLEANYGEPALRQLIDFTLVTQKLKAEKLSVSDAEVDASIQSRADSTPEVKDILASKGVRLNALQRQTRLQMSLDKLLTKDVKATDDQVKKWFETRRKFYDTAAKAKLGILLTTSKPRADTMAAQLKSKSKTFEQLVTEQKAANDPAAGSSVVESPEMITIDVLPALLKNAVNSLQTGGTSNVVTLQEGKRTAYVILRLVQKQAAVKADYAKLKDAVMMDYKLEQVARKLNSENPSNPPFEQTLTQVQNAVRSQGGNPNPGMREILTFITQTQVTTLTNGLRTAAKVETTDPTYTKLIESYKPMPGMTPPGAPGAPIAPAAPAPSAPAPSAPKPAAPAPTAKP